MRWCRVGWQRQHGGERKGQGEDDEQRNQPSHTGHGNASFLDQS